MQSWRIFEVPSSECLQYCVSRQTRPNEKNTTSCSVLDSCNPATPKLEEPGYLTVQVPRFVVGSIAGKHNERFGY